MSIPASDLKVLATKLAEEKLRIEKELSEIANKKGSAGIYETKFDNIGSAEDENTTEVEEYVDNIALENSLEKQLREVLEAIQKIEAGSYGFCDNCSKEIPRERLMAYPAAKKCLACN